MSAEPKDCRRSRRIWKVLFWITLLILSVFIGGGIFAYTYATDSTTLAAIIREQTPRFLVNCRIDAQRVKVHPFIGEVTLRDVSINQWDTPKSHQFLGRSPWIHLSFDPWALLENRLEPKLVVVAQPVVRLRRRADGTWNIQGLIADPWPLPPTPNTPPIRIENGTVELLDEARDDARPLAVLREVSIEVDQSEKDRSILSFTASAKGHLFDRVHLAGTIDKSTGRVVIEGDLDHISVPEVLRGPLPAEIRPLVEAANLTGGEADLALHELVYDPNATPKIRHESTLRLRSGTLTTSRLPFSINDLSASIAIRDDVATIERAEGFNGPTTVRLSGSAVIAGRDRGAFDLALDVTGLELDERLQTWTPAQFKPLWREYEPAGRVDLSWRGARAGVDALLDWRMDVNVRDVALRYHLFRYPLEHLAGRLNCTPDEIRFNVSCDHIGGKRATAVGKIERPGPNPAISIVFSAEALPIDARLKEAMPDDVRKVVDSFSPAGTVRGQAVLTRTPIAAGGDPQKAVRIDAVLDLNPGCEMTWDGMKYKVSNLTGRLEIHPDLWIIRDMLGYHGQAEIRSSGRVARLGPGAFDVSLEIDADNLLFDQQLRDALPTAWKKTWATLNPTGASDVEATIRVQPGQRDDYHLVIHPRPETNLRLSFDRMPEGPELEDSAESRRLEMRLEEITGRFIFDNGKVQMSDGGFLFHGSPISFSKGEVEVYDSGRFALAVSNLLVKDFRLDAGLRKLMPPVMAQFARRIDDGKTLTMRADLGLSWSGKPGELPSCSWNQGLIVLNGNSVTAGIPIRHIQGQIDHLRGRFNGRDLEVDGALEISSVNLFDQQITNVSSPISIRDGAARLTDLEGTLLDGKLHGDLELSLDATPSFSTHLAIHNAQLERYAATLPGKQTFKGAVSGRLELRGMGHDLHTLEGSGEARITQGDLGRLPGIVRLLREIQLAQNTKTAFDSAYVDFRIKNGITRFDPIQFTGDAFSLYGDGSLDAQGDLDVKLSVVYGRDDWHIPVVSDAIREATSPFFVIRVAGTPTSPSFKAVPLPVASEFVKSLGTRTRMREIERRR
ncbi:MAG: AsmA-like C-terminal region-containing protein [Isosphaeraceae bacterium]|nr:AsmA-like C-terminal region-containing protein [Isosphaeraceae bacterium]